MEFVPIVVLGLLVNKIVGALKDASARNWSGLVTLVVTWVAGFAAAGLFAGSAWGDAVKVGGESLASLNLPSLVLAGFAVGSTAATLHDVKKALDGSQTAAEPKLHL